MNALPDGPGSGETGLVVVKLRHNDCGAFAEATDQGTFWCGICRVEFVPPVDARRREYRAATNRHKADPEVVRAALADARKAVRRATRNRHLDVA